MKGIKLIAAMTFGLALASCSGNKASDEATAEVVATADSVQVLNIDGKWNLENIVVNDSVYVRPSEAVPGVEQYVTFDNGEYFIQTNCNTFSGTFTQNGDSITINAGLATEMACDNMATEDMLRQILPNITVVDVENDSVVRLNTSEASSYILLRKSPEQK